MLGQRPGQLARKPRLQPFELNRRLSARGWPRGHPPAARLFRVQQQGRRRPVIGVFRQHAAQQIGQ
jgi:hypothetical protein